MVAAGNAPTYPSLHPDGRRARMEDPANLLFMLPALFLVAFAYAAVGLGGGTAYLAVLSFWIVEPGTLRPTAWCLNAAVAAVALFNFQRKGHLDVGSAWPYALGGLAGAVAGAAVPLPLPVFRWLLAATLGALAAWMFLAGGRKGGEGEPEPRRAAWPLGVFLGFLPGAISGLVGLGGGILLGPVILAMKLLPIRKVAALTSAYILVVSTGALGTHFAGGGTLSPGAVAPILPVVLLGGFLGSRYGAGKARASTLQRLLSLLVLAAAANLVVKALA